MPPHGSFTTEFDAASSAALCRLCRRVGNHAGDLADQDRAKAGAGQPLHPALRQSRQLVGDLPRRAGRPQGSLHGPASSSTISSPRKQGDVELFNGMLDQKMCGHAIEQLVGDAGEVDAWFICGPGPMMDAAESALLERDVAKDRIHIERFTADRPSAALTQEMASSRPRRSGVAVAVTLDGRTRRIDSPQAISSTARAPPDCRRRSRARPGCAPPAAPRSPAAR